jgi:hypothetical protein
MQLGQPGETEYLQEFNIPGHPHPLNLPHILHPHSKGHSHPDREGKALRVSNTALECKISAYARHLHISP